MTSFSFYASVSESLHQDNGQMPFKDILSILQTPPRKRKMVDVERMYNFFNDTGFFADFWGKMPIETCLPLIKELQYEFSPKGKTVFSNGDLATRFYLILQGSVFVTAPQQMLKSSQKSDVSHLEELANNPRTPQHKNETLIGLAERRLKRIASKSRRDVFKNDDNQPLTEEELLSSKPNQIILNTVKQGEYFGDVALRFNTYRTATVISRESSHFMTLTPAVYSQILIDYQKKKEKEILDFFYSIPSMKNWNSESLVSLMYQSTVTTYKRNDIVHNIGDPCDFIYFIKQGEVEIIKEKALHMSVDELSGQAMTLQKAQLVHMNAIWKDQYSKAKSRQVRVALLGPLQSFGDEDFVQLANKRSTKAVIKSQTAEIVVVSFLKFIENRNNSRELCRKLLNMEKSAKNDWRRNFEDQMLKMSLNQSSKLQKAESKLKRELVETIPQLIKSPDEFRNANLEQTVIKESQTKKVSTELYETLISKYAKSKKPQKASKKPSFFTQSESTPGSPINSPKHLLELDEKSPQQNNKVHRNYSVSGNTSPTIKTPKLVSLSQNVKKWARHFEQQGELGDKKKIEESVMKNKSMLSHHSMLSGDYSLLNEINKSIADSTTEDVQRRNASFSVYKPIPFETSPNHRSNKVLGQVFDTRMGERPKLKQQLLQNLHRSLYKSKDDNNNAYYTSGAYLTNTLKKKEQI